MYREEHDKLLAAGRELRDVSQDNQRLYMGFEKTADCPSDHCELFTVTWALHMR